MFEIGIPRKTSMSLAMGRILAHTHCWYVRLCNSTERALKGLQILGLLPRAEAARKPRGPGAPSQPRSTEAALRQLERVDRQTGRTDSSSSVAAGIRGAVAIRDDRLARAVLSTLALVEVLVLVPIDRGVTQLALGALRASPFPRGGRATGSRPLFAPPSVPRPSGRSTLRLRRLLAVSERSVGVRGEAARSACSRELRARPCSAVRASGPVRRRARRAARGGLALGLAGHIGVRGSHSGALLGLAFSPAAPSDAGAPGLREAITTACSGDARRARRRRILWISSRRTRPHSVVGAFPARFSLRAFSTVLPLRHRPSPGRSVRRGVPAAEAASPCHALACPTSARSTPTVARSGGCASPEPPQVAPGVQAPASSGSSGADRNSRGRAGTLGLSKKA